MPQAAKESEAAEAARVKMAAAMAHDNNTAAEMAQLREEVLQLTGAEIETLQAQIAAMDVVPAAEGTDAAVAALTDGSLAAGEGDGGSLLPPYADHLRVLASLSSLRLASNPLSPQTLVFKLGLRCEQGPDRARLRVRHDGGAKAARP